MQNLFKKSASKGEMSASQATNPVVITGDHTFFLDINLQGDHRSSSSQISITAYSKSDKRIPVPVSYKWFRSVADTSTLIKDAKGPVYQLTSLDIGCTITAAVTPVDPQESGVSGEAIVEYGPIAIDISLRVSLEKILAVSTDPKFPIELIYENFQSNQLQKVKGTLSFNSFEVKIALNEPSALQKDDLNKSMISLANDSVLGKAGPRTPQVRFRYSFESPMVQPDSADLNRLAFVFKGTEEDYLKVKGFCNSYIPKEFQNPLSTGISLEFLVDSRITRDTIMLALRCLAAQYYIKSSAIISESPRLNQQQDVAKLNYDSFIEIERLKKELNYQLSKSAQLVKDKEKLQTTILEMEDELTKTIGAYSELLQSQGNTELNESRRGLNINQEELTEAVKKLGDEKCELEDEIKHLKNKLEAASQELEQYRSSTGNKGRNSGTVKLDNSILSDLQLLERNSRQSYKPGRGTYRESVVVGDPEELKRMNERLTVENQRLKKLIENYKRTQENMQQSHELLRSSYELMTKSIDLGYAANASPEKNNTEATRELRMINDILSIENNTYKVQIESLNKDISSLKAKLEEFNLVKENDEAMIKQLKSKLEDFEAGKSNVEAEILELNNALKKKTEEVQTVRKELQLKESVFKDLSALRKEKLALQEKNTALESKISELESRNQELLVIVEVTNLIEADSTNLKEIQARLNEVREQCERAKTSVEAKQKEAEELLANQNEESQKIENIRSQLRDLMQELHKLSMTKEAETEKKQNLDKEVNGLKEQNEKTENLISQENQKFTALAAEKSRIKEKILQVEAENAETQQKLMELTEENKRLVERLREREGHLKTAEQEYQSLSKQVESFERLKVNSLQGHKQQLSKEIVSFDKELEDLRSVFAQKLGLVKETQQKIEASDQELVKLENVLQEKMAKLSQAKINFESELTRCTTEQKNIETELEGLQAGIEKKRAEKLQKLQKIEEISQEIREKDTGLESLQSELNKKSQSEKNLKEKLREIEGNLSSMNERVASVEKTIQELHQARDGKEATIKVQKSELTKLEQQSDTLALEYQRLTHVIEERKLDIQAKEAAVKDLEEETEKIQSTLKAKEREKETLETKINTLTSEINELAAVYLTKQKDTEQARKRIDEENQILKNLLSDASVITERVHIEKINQVKLEGDIKQQSSDILKLKTDLQEGEAELQALNAEHKEQVGKIAAKKKECEKLRKEIELLEQKKMMFSDDRSSLELCQQDLDKQRSELEAEIEQKQLNLETLRKKEEEIEKKIAELKAVVPTKEKDLAVLENLLKFISEKSANAKKEHDETMVALQANMKQNKELMWQRDELRAVNEKINVEIGAAKKISQEQAVVLQDLKKKCENDQKEVDQLKTTVKSLETERAALESNIAELKRIISAEELPRNELKKKIEDFKGKNSDLQQELENLVQAQKRMHSSKEMLTAENEELLASINTNKARNSELMDKVEELEKQFDQVSREKLELEGKLQKENEIQKKISWEIEQLVSQTKLKQTEYSKLKEREITFDQENHQLANRVAEKEKEHARLAEKLQKLIDEIQTLSLQKEEKGMTLKMLSDEVHELTGINAKNTEKLTQTRKEKEKIEESLSNLNRDHASLVQQHQALEEKVAEETLSVSSLEKKLKELKDQSQELTSKIETESAAIKEKEAEARELDEQIAQISLEIKAQRIEIDDLKSQKSKLEKNAAGLAATIKEQLASESNLKHQLSEIDDRMTQLKNLLGNKTRDKSTLEKELEEMRTSSDQMNGELLRQIEELSLGTEKLRRELNEKKELHESLTANIKMIQGGIAPQEERKASLQKELETLNEKVKSQEKTLAERMAKHNDLASKLDEVAHEISVKQKDIAEKSDQISNLESTLLGFNGKETEIRQIGGLTQELKAKQAQIEKYELEIQRINQEINDLKGLYQVSQTELQSKTNENEKLAQESMEKINQITRQFQEQLTNKEEEVSDLKDKLTHTLSDLKARSEEVKNLTIENQRLRTELQTLNNEIAQTLEKSKQATNDLSAELAHVKEQLELKIKENEEISKKALEEQTENLRLSQMFKEIQSSMRKKSQESISSIDQLRDEIAGFQKEVAILQRRNEQLVELTHSLQDERDKNAEAHQQLLAESEKKSQLLNQLRQSLQGCRDFIYQILSLLQKPNAFQELPKVIVPENLKESQPELQSLLSALNELGAQSKQTEESLTQKLVALEHEKQVLNDAINAKAQELAEYQTMIDSLKQNAMQIAEKLSEAELEREKLEAELRVKIEETQNEKATTEVLNSQLELLKTENTKHQSYVKEAQGQLQECLRNLEQERAKVTEIQNKCKGDLIKATEATEKIERALREANDQKARLLGLIESIKELVKQANVSIKEDSELVEVLTKIIKASSENKEGKASPSKEEAQRIEALDKHLKELQDQNKQNLMMIDQLMKTNNKFMQENSNLMEQNMQLSEELESLKENQGGGRVIELENMIIALKKRNEELEGQGKMNTAKSPAAGGGRRFFF